jgi:adenylate cyclase
MATADAIRRLTAIVAVDVAGYSRLVAADEEATLSAYRNLRVEFIDIKIAEFRGRIANTAGDSLLIEFPSVVDALRFAIDLQRGMAERNIGVAADRRIEFRAGINLGDVVEQDGDLLGDGVNVAARLEGLAEPGGICLSGAAHDQVRGRVDVGFADLGDIELKNIPLPVRAYRVLLSGETGPKVARRRPVNRPILVALALTIVGAAVLGLWGSQFYYDGAVRVLPATTADMPHDRPSIAVLPFTNMSNDAEQDYFSDGVTEDVITDLSRLSGLFVIARNTMFTYKGRAVNVKQVSADLGVRYVLEGSIRRSGDRVRINVQLIDANTGGHVWADRFDRELGEIFALQDDVTQQIVSALALELTTDEQARLKSTNDETSPEVYDVYLRGVEALRQYTPESIIEARTYFLKALALDPDYARAYAAMAFSYTASGIFFRSENTDEAVVEALRYSGRAVEIDDTLPLAHFARAIALLRQGSHEEALATARKAVRYDPNYADGYAALANVLFYSGDGAAAEQAIREAMHLNPRFSAPYIELLGRAYFMMGRYDEAIGPLRDCVSRDPGQMTCHAYLAAVYGLIGQTEEAQWEVEETLGLEPGYSLKTDPIAMQFLNPEDRERFQSGLRRAGIPEE